MTVTSKVLLIGLAEAAVAVAASSLFVNVAYDDAESWPALAVLIVGVGFFGYGCVKAYRCTPAVTVLSALVALGIVTAFTLSDAVWRHFPLLFVGLAASTAVVLAALKAIVAGILERRFP